MSSDQTQQSDAGDAGSAQKGCEEACPPLWRSLCAETLGTFALTFVAAGGEVIAAVCSPRPSAARP